MEQFAQLIILLLVAVLAINLISGGGAGVRAWLSAKFLGKPLAGASS